MNAHLSGENAAEPRQFLKEHNKVEEQRAAIAKLKSMVAQQQQRFVQQEQEIAALTSGLQKVTAQVETIKAIPRMVANK